MCGIAGLFRAAGQTQEIEILKMTDAVRHRGPDGSGIKMFSAGGIGNRRLAVIDTLTGSQPQCNEDETVWITFNGEIYNFRELNRELTERGHRFKTKSDTEAIVHAYEEWGTECLNRFRGMFAFAIVDTRKRIVFLARDHFGIKPLYFLKTDRVFAFGSELQQFRCIKDFNPTLDLKAVDEYLWLQYIPAPKTVFQNVSKLRPAHYVIYSFDGVLQEPQSYWQLDFSEKNGKDEREWLAGLDDVLKKSVEAHLISDVPFGAFLSGGIDSTLVVSYMSGLLKSPVKTFSIGFAEEEFNELEYSRRASQQFQTEHHFEIVKPDALEVLPTLVKHYGEPYGDSSCIPTYYLCKLAREYVTVALSGDGGDECFGGYSSYSSWMSRRTTPSQQRANLKSRLFPWTQQKPEKLFDWISGIQYLDSDWRRRLWKKDFAFAYNKRVDELDRIYAQTKDLGLLNMVQFMDVRSYLVYDILTKVDIASMIHSLEVRTPLVDKEVWEFAVTIPENLNMNDAQEKGNFRGKLLLKKLLSPHFDEQFLHRKKQGFAVPLRRWFSEKGELRTVLQDYLLSSDSRVFQYFKKESVLHLTSVEHAGGQWLLLFLEEWLRNFHQSVTTKTN